MDISGSLRINSGCFKAPQEVGKRQLVSEKINKRKRTMQQYPFIKPDPTARLKVLSSSDHAILPNQVKFCSFL